MTRYIFVLTLLFSVTAFGVKGFKDVYIGNDKSLHDASTILQIDSVTQGFLAPRMDQTERDNIATR